MIKTNAEFLEFEGEQELPLTAYTVLMTSIHKQHDFREYRGQRLCKGCSQDVNFLIYTKQVECVGKIVRKPKKGKMVGNRPRLVALDLEEFQLKPPA